VKNEGRNKQPSRVRHRQISSIVGKKPIDSMPHLRASPPKPRKRSEPRPLDLQSKKSHLKERSILTLSSSSSFMSHETHQHQLDEVLTSLRSEAWELEEKLTKHLDLLSVEDVMTKDKFRVYQQFFDRVISKDHCFGSLLLKVKTAYEDWIRVESFSLSHQMRQELTAKEDQIDQFRHSAAKLEATIAKLAKENGELSRSLDEADIKGMELQQHLMKLSKVKEEAMPKDASSWQYLVAENKHYSEELKNLRKELKYMKQREKRLLMLISTLHKDGYPVEEAYRAVCRKSTKLPYKKVPGSIEEGDMLELLVEGPPKSVERPQVITRLDLGQVETYLTSDSECASGSSSSDCR
jgi:cell division protein FtsB